MDNKKWYKNPEMIVALSALMIAGYSFNSATIAFNVLCAFDFTSINNCKDLLLSNPKAIAS